MPELGKERRRSRDKRDWRGREREGLACPDWREGAEGVAVRMEDDQGELRSDGEGKLQRLGSWMRGVRWLSGEGVGL